MCVNVYTHTPTHPHTHGEFMSQIHKKASVGKFAYMCVYAYVCVCVCECVCVCVYDCKSESIISIIQVLPFM
jgi:hypothetical protein